LISSEQRLVLFWIPNQSAFKTSERDLRQEIQVS
jgi:hypothetical protein